jgi:glycosyltransferase involved in cell wall biosynthesis
MNMETTKVTTSTRLSIVTISFNQAKYLTACLESIVSQKDESVEFIVVDPGSTDGSRDILRQYADRIDHLVLESDDGPADGLNKGFSLATGELAYFINSDDFLMPGAVQRLRAFWNQNPNADVGMCEAWLVDGEARPLRRLRPSRAAPALLVDGRCIPVQQGLSFKMSAFRDIGGFQTSNRSSWDLELLFDFALAGKRIARGQARIGAFRLYGDSLSGGATGDGHRKRLILDRERMRNRLPAEQRVLPIRLAALLRNLGNPKILADAIMARYAPSLLSRAWLRDTAHRTAGNA